jgi:hypothetical protein
VVQTIKKKQGYFEFEKKIFFTPISKACFFFLAYLTKWIQNMSQAPPFHVNKIAFALGNFNTKCVFRKI